MLALWWIACSTPTPTVDLDELELVRSEGVFRYDDVPFTGHAEHHGPEGVLLERTTFRHGRRHGQRALWYPDGSPRMQSRYVDGRRDGVVRSWWPNGNLRSEGHLVDGVVHGVQRQWYATGTLFKELRYDKGTEAGLQRAWRENGALYTNYEARDGRIYGLKRAQLCFQLDDEEVVRGDERVDRVRAGVRDAGAGL